MIYCDIVEFEIHTSVCCVLVMRIYFLLLLPVLAIFVVQIRCLGDKQVYTQLYTDNVQCSYLYNPKPFTCSYTERFLYKCETVSISMVNECT